MGARENGNCAPAGKITKMPPAVKAKVAELKEQQEELMKLAEQFADKDDLTSSKQAVAAAKKASTEIEELKEQHTFMSEGDQVCNICGVRCNPNMEADFYAHQAGRLHEGYTKIREMVTSLREKVRNRPQPSADDRDKKRSERGKES